MFFFLFVRFVSFLRVVSKHNFCFLLFCCAVRAIFLSSFFIVLVFLRSSLQHWIQWTSRIHTHTLFTFILHFHFPHIIFFFSYLAVAFAHSQEKESESGSFLIPFMLWFCTKKTAFSDENDETASQKHHQNAKALEKKREKHFHTE